MRASLPIEVQVYAFGMMLGFAVPFLLFWFLLRPLREFLNEIFNSPAIEEFWLRVVLIGFLASTLSVAVVFQPADASKADEVALFFNVADKFKQMLDSLIYAMLAIFLPLLAAYTILHMSRRGGEQAGPPGK
jgi:hypothetical protein